jgi:hypothetical protein
MVLMMVASGRKMQHATKDTEERHDTTLRER